MLAKVAILAALLPLAVSAAEDGKLARVTLLNGEAAVLRGGAEATRENVGNLEKLGNLEHLQVGGQVMTGDTVIVGDTGFIELTLPDKSVVRIAPSSRFVLEEVDFAPTGERKFSVRLFFGSIWSKVSAVLGGVSKFEVKTENAVAGVRGTTFRVDAKVDKSAVVSVFAGSVAVGQGGPLSAPHKPGERKEKAPPKEVSKQEWEKLVLAMMKIRVGANGVPGEPEKLAESDIDDFARRNQKLDKK